MHLSSMAYGVLVPSQRKIKSSLVSLDVCVLFQQDKLAYVCQNKQLIQWTRAHLFSRPAA